MSSEIFFLQKFSLKREGQLSTSVEQMTKRCNTLLRGRTTDSSNIKFIAPCAARTGGCCGLNPFSLVLLPALPLDHRPGHGNMAQKCSTARESVPVPCAERGHMTYVQLSRKPLSSSYRQTEHWANAHCTMNWIYNNYIDCLQTRCQTHRWRWCPGQGCICAAGRWARWWAGCRWWSPPG